MSGRWRRVNGGRRGAELLRRRVGLTSTTRRRLIATAATAPDKEAQQRNYCGEGDPSEHELQPRKFSATVIERSVAGSLGERVVVLFRCRA